MPSGMSEPPPLAATLPPRRALILLASIWAISVVPAAGLVRELNYSCSTPPALTLLEGVACAPLLAMAAALAVALYGWARPQTRVGRLGATLLSALGSAVPCLWVCAFLLSFNAYLAMWLAWMGSAIVPPPAAIVIWGVAEFMGWFWTPGAR